MAYMTETLILSVLMTKVRNVMVIVMHLLHNGLFTREKWVFASFIQCKRWRPKGNAQRGLLSDAIHLPIAVVPSVLSACKCIRFSLGFSRAILNAFNMIEAKRCSTTMAKSNKSAQQTLELKCFLFRPFSHTV